MQVTSILKTENITSSVNPEFHLSESLEMSSVLSEEGFESEEIPESITIYHKSFSEEFEEASFLSVAATNEEAVSLIKAGTQAVAVNLSTLGLFLKTTKRAPGGIERLGRAAGAVVFVIPAITAPAALAAVNESVSKLKESSVHATAFLMPKNHATTSAWIEEVGAMRVKSALCAAAMRAKGLQQENPMTGGFLPMGYQNGTYYVWSTDQGELKEISEGNLDKASILLSLAGSPHLIEHYLEEDRRGNKFVNFRSVASEIRQKCVAKGPFKSENTRGAGVWREKDHLIVNTDKAFHAIDGAPVDRVAGKYTYMRARDLGVTPETQIATVEEMQEIHDFLGTFNWSRKSDCTLMFGWICASYVCAALPQRPHIFLHADAKSGKTTMLKFIRFLLGDSVMSFSGQNEAGLRQKMRKTSIACLLDETGADSSQASDPHHLAKLLRFLRMSFDGSRQSKGTAQHTAVDFEIRTMGLVAGVVPPAMDSQEASRFLMIQLNPMIEYGGANHRLFTSENAEENQVVSDMGQRVFARSLANWTRFRSAMATLSRVASTSGRANDTLMPAIASSYVALHDKDFACDDDAKSWLNTFDIADDIERIERVSSGDEFIEKLSSMVVSTSAAGFRAEMSIAELLDRAHDDSGRGPWKQNLGLLGLKLAQIEGGAIELRINTSADGFTKLIANTKWRSGDIDSIIKRIPGASLKKLNDKIGGASCRYLSIPFIRSEEKFSELSSPK